MKTTLNLPLERKLGLVERTKEQKVQNKSSSYPLLLPLILSKRRTLNGIRQVLVKHTQNVKSFVILLKIIWNGSMEYFVLLVNPI